MLFAVECFKLFFKRLRNATILRLKLIECGTLSLRRGTIMETLEIKGLHWKDKQAKYVIISDAGVVDTVNILRKVSFEVARLHREHLQRAISF